MAKAIFIGYPIGYKGWKFYILSTKRTVISERADFDERYFPGLKMNSLSATPQSYTSTATTEIVWLSDLEGDDAPPPSVPSEPVIQAPALVQVPEPQIDVLDCTPSPEVPEPPSPPQPAPEPLPRCSGHIRVRSLLVSLLDLNLVITKRP